MQNVRAALVTAFQTVSLGVSSTSVCYENETRPTADGPWAEFHFIPGPAKAVTLGVGGLDLCQGICQININDQLGNGEALGAAAYSALRDKFVVGTTLIFMGQSVTVTSCSRSGGHTLNGWYRISITIGWKAYLTRKV